MSFRAGDRVSHPKFGDGAVVAVRDLGDDQEVTIAFVGAGVKKLMASLARIEFQSASKRTPGRNP